MQTGNVHLRSSQQELQLPNFVLQLKECIDNLKQILPADATVSRLEHCYGVISDREKDFVTAAEIGQMLLERNQILSAKLEELEADPSSVNSQVKQMQEQYNALQLQIKTLSQRHNELMEHCKSMETHIDRLEGDKHSLELKVVRLVDEYSAAREKWKSEQPKQKANADYKEKMTKLLDEIDQYQIEIEELKKAKQSLKEENARLNLELKSADRKAAPAGESADMEIIRQKLDRGDKAEAKVRELTAELQRLKQRNDELSRVAEEKAHLDGVVQSLLKANKIFQNEQDEQQNLIDSLKKELAALNAKMEEMKLELAQPKKPSLFGELNSVTQQSFSDLMASVKKNPRELKQNNENDAAWLRRMRRSKSMISNQSVSGVPLETVSNEDVSMSMSGTSSPAGQYFPAAASAPVSAPIAAPRRPATPKGSVLKKAPSGVIDPSTAPLTPISSKLFEKAMREADAISASAVELAQQVGDPEILSAPLVAAAEVAAQTSPASSTSSVNSQEKTSVGAENLGLFAQMREPRSKEYMRKRRSLNFLPHAPFASESDSIAATPSAELLPSEEDLQKMIVQCGGSDNGSIFREVNRMRTLLQSERDRERDFVQRVEQLCEKMRDSNLTIMNKTMRAILSFKELIDVSNVYLDCVIQTAVQMRSMPVYQKAVFHQSLALLTQAAALQKRNNDLSEGINQPLLEKLAKFQQEFERTPSAAPLSPSSAQEKKGWFDRIKTILN